MRPEDPHLADAVGSISEAMENMNNARPLMARMNVDNAYTSLQKYINEREEQ